MAQFARPASTVTSDSWSATPGGSHHLRIDEGEPPDDADFVSSPAPPGGSGNDATFTTNNVTDPAVSTGHIIRVRWSSSASANDGHAELWQGDPDSGGSQVASLDRTSSFPSSPTTETYTLSGAEADAITDYTDLYLRIWGDKTGGGPNRDVDIYLLELEVPDVAGPQIIAVGAATESEVAQAVPAVKAVAVGAPSETETPQPVPAVKVPAIGQASELEVAQPVAAVKPIIQPVGQASEVETAQAVPPVKTVTVGLASELEVAQVVAALKTVTVGLASEVEVAQVVLVQQGGTVIPVGVATETETAQAVPARIIVTVGQATEAEVAQAVAAVKPIIQAVGAAVELEIPVAVIPVKVGTVGTAVELETALTVGALKPIIVTVGTVTETEVAQAVTVSVGALIRRLESAPAEGTGLEGQAQPDSGLQPVIVVVGRLEGGSA